MGVGASSDRRLRLAGVVVAAVVIAGAATVALSGDRGDGGDDERPLAPFAFPPGEMLVPGEIEGYELLHLYATEPDGRADGSAPLVVARFEGQAVAVHTTSRAAVEARRGAAGPVGPDHRVATVGDRPTVSYGWDMVPTGDADDLALSWWATDDVLVTAGSRALDIEAVARFAAGVRVGADGRLDVPGERIGEIPASWTQPSPGVSAAYERSGSGVQPRITLRTYRADASVQKAFLAMAAPDGSIGPETHYSCCAGPMPPRRTLDVDGRKATAVALTADTHLVVLHGDEGGIIFVEAGRYNAVPDDETLAGIASSLTPVASDAFEPFGPQPDRPTDVITSPG